MSTYEFTGKTVKDAIETACRELNVDEALLEVKVLEESARGFLGIVGQRDARIKVRKRDILKEVMEVKEVKEKPAAAPEKTPVRDVPEPEARAPQPPRSTSSSRAEESAAPPTTSDANGALARAANVLEEILGRMPVETEVQSEMRNGSIYLRIKGDGSGLLIGKKGQTLDALQYIVSKIVNREIPPGSKFQITVDTEDYRARKTENLREKALKVSARAKRSLKPVWFDPMPPNERRIVHMILADDREIYTKSHGEGPMRRIVVYPRRGVNKRRGR
jgi:spoIIIJ-associated protein